MKLFFDVQDYYINISVLLPKNTKKKEYTLKSFSQSLSLLLTFIADAQQAYIHKSQSFFLIFFFFFVN